MKLLNPYRIASLLLVFFTIAHTAGGLYGAHDYGTAAEAVFASMKTVSFVVFGATRTWYDFWIGFGLLVTIFLAFSAVMTWCLGGLDRQTRQPFLPICWALFAAHAVNVYLSWRYFFTPPIVTSTLVTTLIGVECVRDSRA